MADVDAAPGQSAPAAEGEQAVEAEETEVEPAASPALAALYGKHSFPASSLAPEVPVSAVIAACWPEKDAQELLKQSWMPQPAEDAEDAPTPAAFDPTSVEYTVLPQRLAKTQALQDVNRLKFDLKGKEEELAVLSKQKKPNPDDLEACQTAVAEATEKLQEAQTALQEVQASFQEDALALTPWMNALFATADLGLTTLAVGPGTWPSTPAASVFTAKDGAEATEGAEKMLAAFQKRFALERGPGKTNVVLRLAPNVFREGFSSEAVSACVTRLMEAQGLDPEGEAPGSLAAVELAWWDHAGGARSPIETLQQLDKLCQDETEADPDSGEVTVTAPRKIRALGVFDFPDTAIEQAVQNGVEMHFAHVHFGLHNARAALETLALCKRYGIRVVAGGGLMHGCVHEDFVGVPCPSHDSDPADPAPSGLAGLASVVQAFGGWAGVQAALRAVQQIARKHGVSMRAVVLRWQMDLGATPVVAVDWSDPGGALGKAGETGPAVPDAALFQRASFLDEEDMEALQGLYK